MRPMSHKVVTSDAPNVTELMPTYHWTGESSIWDAYVRSCPPAAPVRKQLSSLRLEDTTFANSTPHGTLNATRPRSNLDMVNRRMPLSSHMDDPSPLPSAADIAHSEEFDFASWDIGITREKLCINHLLHQEQGAFFSVRAVTESCDSTTYPVDMFKHCSFAGLSEHRSVVSRHVLAAD